VSGGNNGSIDVIPIGWLKEWIRDERLPRGWKYTHTQGFFDSVKMSTDLQNAMKKLTQEVDIADDEAVNGFSDSASSSDDSFFVSGEAADTTLPTSDSEDRTKRLDDGRGR
jgi:hypothetical protein